MSSRFTPAARSQLLQAVGYMADRRTAAVRAFLDSLEKRLEDIEQIPDTGRRVPEFPDLPYREVRVPPYRIFYRTRESGLWVVGVWHDTLLPGYPNIGKLPGSPWSAGLQPGMNNRTTKPSGIGRLTALHSARVKQQYRPPWQARKCLIPNGFFGRFSLESAGQPAATPYHVLGLAKSAA